jgi:hypothetical protein
MWMQNPYLHDVGGKVIMLLLTLNDQRGGRGWLAIVWNHGKTIVNNCFTCKWNTSVNYRTIGFDKEW